jgi:hypothetical protein
MHYRVPSLGIAEQRDFLLRQSTAQYVLYLDDDVWMEPHVLKTMVETIESQQCGFVGAFPAGLSYRDDYRPHQQQIEFWEGDVTPESILPDSQEWERNVLHRAANLHHVSLHIPHGERYLYKIAWIAACIFVRSRETERDWRFRLLGTPSAVPKRRRSTGAEFNDAPLGRLLYRPLWHLLFGNAIHCA